MHPDLQLLEQRYRALVDDVNAGHLSPQDAMVTMAGLVAIDASGSSWTIDPYTGQFTRSVPGSAPLPADPSQFTSAGPSQDLPLSPGPAMSAWDSPTNAPAPRAAPSVQATPGSRLAFLTAIMHGRGRIVAVAVVAILAILALVLLRPSPQEATPDSNSSSSSAAPDSSESPTESPDPSPSASPTKTEAPLELPSEKRRSDLLRLLSGGDRQSLVNQFAGDADPTRVLLSAAPISGAARLGFAIRGNGVTSDKEGVAVFGVTVSDASGVLQSFRVPLARTDGAWRISGPITMDAK